MLNLAYYLNEKLTSNQDGNKSQPFSVKGKVDRKKFTDLDGILNEEKGEQEIRQQQQHQNDGGFDNPFAESGEEQALIEAMVLADMAEINEKQQQQIKIRGLGGGGRRNARRNISLAVVVGMEFRRWRIRGEE